MKYFAKTIQKIFDVVQPLHTWILKESTMYAYIINILSGDVALLLVCAVFVWYHPITSLFMFFFGMEVRKHLGMKDGQ